MGREPPCVAVPAPARGVGAGSLQIVLRRISVPRSWGVDGAKAARHNVHTASIGPFPIRLLRDLGARRRRPGIRAPRIQRQPESRPHRHLLGLHPLRPQPPGAATPLGAAVPPARGSTPVPPYAEPGGRDRHRTKLRHGPRLTHHIPSRAATRLAPLVYVNPGPRPGRPPAFGIPYAAARAARHGRCTSQSPRDCKRAHQSLKCSQVRTWHVNPNHCAASGG